MGSFWGKVEAVEIFWALIVSLERLDSCDGGGVRVHDVCHTMQIDPKSHSLSRLLTLQDHER